MNEKSVQLSLNDDAMKVGGISSVLNVFRERGPPPPSMGPAAEAYIAPLVADAAGARFCLPLWLASDENEKIQILLNFRFSQTAAEAIKQQHEIIMVNYDEVSKAISDLVAEKNCGPILIRLGR